MLSNTVALFINYIEDKTNVSLTFSKWKAEILVFLYGMGLGLEGEVGEALEV